MALSRPQFIPNPLVTAELKAGNPIIDAELARIREAVAQEARDIAPVDTGDFRDSIRASDEGVVSDDPGAWAIEMGTEDTPPHGTLRRAAENVTGHQVKARED